MGIRRRLLPASALFLTASVGWSAPLWGRLAFVRDGAAWVADLGQGGLTRLPSSRGASDVWLAPRSGQVIWTVPAGDDRVTAHRSAPPYQTSTLLPLVGDRLSKVVWARDGRRAFLAGGASAMLDVVTGSQRPLTCPIDGVSPDGSQIVYGCDFEIRLREPATGFDRRLFSGLDQPDFLPPSADIRGEVPHSAWAMGDPAFTADGAEVLFTTNLGRYRDGLGLAVRALLSVNPRDGSCHQVQAAGLFEEAVRADGFDSRLCRPAPVGGRVLVTTILDNDAGPLGTRCGRAWLIDPAAGCRRELLWRDGPEPRLGSMVDGAAWSPDGRYVAIGLGVGRAGRNEAVDLDFAVLIYETESAQLIRHIAGARMPSWGY